MNLLKKIIISAITTPAKIAKVDVISKCFRIINLESEAFKKVQWQPGSKIGIILDGDKRTYTPVSLDTTAGHLKLLIYLHGKGRGSAWASTAKVSVRCQFMGPRPSLDFSKVIGPAVLFGDETSFAVASTLKTHLGKEAMVKFIFEVSSVDEALVALRSVGIEDALLIERQTADGSHLKQAAAEVSKSISDLKSDNLVLTGCGSSIQILRAFLTREEVSFAKNKTKAYWSPGKLGLD